MATWPTVTWQADWVHGPNQGAQTWTSLQSLGNTTVTGFKTGRGRQYELDLIESGTAEIAVADLAEYLNPGNTNSPWNSGSNSLDLYRQVQIQATWSGTTYNLFTGYIERYESEWDFSGFLGRRTLQCVDALALLNRRTFASIVRETILAYSPTTYIPLGDAAGSTTASAWDGSRTYSLQNVGAFAAPYGALTFGTTSPAGSWDSGTWATFTPGNAANAKIVATPAVTGSTFTVMFAFKTTNALSNVAEVWSQADSNSIPVPTDLHIGGGLVGAGVQTGPSTSASLYTTSVAFNDGKAHVVALVCSPGSCILYYDGVSVATAAATATPTGGVSGLGSDYYGLSSYPWPGSIGHFAMWQGTALTGPQVATISAAITYGLAGDTTDARVTRALNAAPWTGYGSSIDGGNSAESACLWNGLTVKQVMQQSAVTEGGAAWVDAAGKVRFSSRGTIRGTTGSGSTFGENVSGGEFPYQGDGNLLFSKDPTKIANQVTVTNANGTIGYSTISASVTSYGPSGLAISTDFNDTTSPKNAADWYANLYSQAIQRVERVVLDPASYNALWPVVLGLELFQVVTLTRRPSSGASVMSARYTVQRIEHDVDFSAGKWLTSLWLAPAALTQALVLDDATFGSLDNYPLSY